MTITATRLWRALATAVLALPAISLLAAPSAAAVLVLESGVQGIAAHDVLEDDKFISVPFGRRLLVSVPKGERMRQVEIRGKREGTVKELLEPESMPQRLWQLAVELVRNGGASQSQKAAGRGARVLVEQVPVAGARTVCVESGRLPVISLANDPDVTKVVLRVHDGTSAPSGAIELTRRSPRSEWPSGISPRDKGLYRLIESGHPVVDLTLRVLPAGTLERVPDFRALDELQRAGCTAQLEAAMWRGIRTEK
jgi:hypothetical protein